ncbi:MAG TPA: iron uptake porin [Leptolyngbyaceae cyanobacterium]
MTKFFLAALKLSAIILGSAFLVDNYPLVAQEAIFQLDPLVQEEENPLANVTSVSQLEDVQPTDWAFQALQSLIERYGVIAGYPDGTFRGNRAMTRYEFAAGLNAALTRIEELIDTGSTNLSHQGNQVREEDLVTLRRLQTDFATELANLPARVDNLQATTALLEATQFSTTTKLNGIILFNITAARAAGDVKVERIDPQDVFSAARRGEDGKPIVTRVADDPEVTFSHITGLFLTTSFTGKDSLVTSLVTGSGNSPANVYTSAGFYNSFGTPGSDFTPTTTANQIALLESFYSFPINDSIRAIVGPRLFWLSYFDTNAFTNIFGKGASGFNTFGSPLVQELGRGAGAIVTWRIDEQFDWRVGYTVSPNAASPNTGFFNGNRAFTTQLTYSPISKVNLRLIYDRSRILPVDGQIRTKPIIGVADDGFGGELENATANSFGFNFDWLITPQFGLFGRYTYSTTRLNPASDGMESGHINVQSVQLGVALLDLGKKGALATISYVVPFDILDGRQFLVSGGGDGGTQYEIEANYYFPVNGNIAIVPTFYITGNPNNFDRNPTVFSGAVRTQFNF